MNTNDIKNLIVMNVPKCVLIATYYDMAEHNTSLYDAFKYAIENCNIDHNSELYKAWYHSDFRRFIPSAYIDEYLDFEKYPLKYAIANN